MPALSPTDAEVLVDGETLELDRIVTAARHPGTARFRLAPAAAARIRSTAAVRRRLVETGHPVYGVTTGFGDSADRQVSPDRAAELQHRLIRYHLNGAGPDCPAEVVRAMLLIRANCLARGVSGVRVELVELLLALLAEDILPVVPQWGSVGASGDLVPSCYVAAVLTGEGEVCHRGRVRPAAEALRECRLQPLALEPKEGLALINGTSFMTAFAVLAVADSAALGYTADLCTALATQVLAGYAGHFDEFLTRHKPHPGQADSAGRIHRLLAGSRLCTAPPAGETGYRRLARQVQDRYSLRCAPHVTGVLHDTLDWVRSWVETEVNSANDNPLFDPERGTVHTGGNFFGGHVAQAMDALKVAVASVGDLLDRQLALVVDEKFSNGLPANLAPAGGDNGLQHGYKGMQIAGSAFAAEALSRAGPASVFSRSTEAHNQDKVSMGAVAARDAYQVVELVAHVAAVHLHALCQAADLRGPQLLSSATRRAYRTVREQVDFLAADRRMDRELTGLVSLIRSGALRAAVDRPGTRATGHQPGDRYDAIVIGGGPAGATAARQLARRGCDVLLLERHRFPRFHIGESLLPYACAALERLRLADTLAEVGFPVKCGAEFTGTDGSRRRVDFTAQGGGRAIGTYQVERADFDDVLLRAAAGAGATVRQGGRVTGVLTGSQGRVVGVRYQHQDRLHHAYAPWVLDASGRAGVIPHQHLRSRQVSDRLRMVALYRHFDGVDEATNPGVTGDIQIGNHADGWVWAIPVRADRLSVGAVLPPEVLAGADRQAVFDAHVARIPRIAQRLSGTTAVAELRGESDFCYHTEALAGPGFFVLGDAGCFADPIFSGGVYLSLLSGWRAADLVADLLAGRREEAEATAAYQRFYQTGYDCYFRLIYAFYESGFAIGRYLRGTGVDVHPQWLARLLSGDFWSQKNPLAEHLRGVARYATFAGFEPLYGCPVYPELDAREPAGAALGSAPR